MKRICQTCGSTFDGDNTAVTCPECVKKLRSTSLGTRVCVVCGVSFLGGPSAKYCPTCRLEIARQRDREHKRKKRAGAVRPLGSEDICIRCGKKYTVNAGLQKYCPDCSAEAIRENDRKKSIEWNRANVNMKEKIAQRHKAAAPEVCVVCGKEFIPGSGSPKTCSKECAEILRKKYNQDYEKAHRNKRNARRRELYKQKKAREASKMKAYNNSWDQLVELMNDDIREAVHAELAPCTNEEFLERYLELDPDFQATLDQFAPDLET